MILFAEIALRIQKSHQAESIELKVDEIPTPKGSTVRVRVFQRLVNGKAVQTWRETKDGYLRKQPAPPTSARMDRHAVFLGAADTYGRGVDDNKTYPYFFSEQRPEIQVLNFGIPGSSISSALYHYDEMRLKERIAHPEGFAAISLHQDLDLERLKYSFLNRRLFRVDEPFYDLDSAGGLKLLGTMAEIHPVKSKIFSAFWNWDFAILERLRNMKNTETKEFFYSAKEEDLGVEILASLAKRYRADFPQGEFYVFTGDALSPFYRKLTARGLKVVQLNLKDLNSPMYRLPHDYNLNPEAYQEIARQLYPLGKKKRAQP